MRLYWSLSKVVRIENGTVSLQVSDLRALLGLFKVVDADEVAKLTAAAQIARQRGWQKKYGNALDPGFDAYLSYEGTASAIMTFETLTIPGLLQTVDYTRAILVANGAAQIADRIALRQERQELLRQAGAPDLICVVDEAALHRQVGGAAVMSDQLTRLRAAAESDKISVEVVPYAAGAYRSMIESFTLLHSQRWDEDVLFREGAWQTVTDHEDRELIAEYRTRFSRLREVSLRGERVSSLIDAVIGELRGTAPVEQPPRAERPE